MDTEPNSSAKIDRLSSLPPELLLTIFDLAYDSDQLLLEPLSKRLLPYFRRNLYRQIRITSQAAWSKLLATVKDSPALGELVLDLNTSRAFTHRHSTGCFDEIVKPFPRLNSVKTGYIQPLPTSLSFALLYLRTLSYQCDKLSIADLPILSDLPLLIRLDVKFNDAESTDHSIPSRTLTALEQLSLHRDDRDGRDPPEWPHAVATLISRCPNLTQLKLSDSWLPHYGSLLPSLTFLYPRLEKLETATSDEIDSFYGLACDLHLPLFSNLRHLDLADNTLERALCSYLRQLLHLSFLRLGRNTHIDGPPSSELLSLVQGPTKLVSLRSLVLDCMDGKVGDRLSWEGAGRGDENSWKGWTIPEFQDPFDLADIRQLSVIGAQNLVSTSGSAIEAVAVWDAYLLEEANRTVHTAFKSARFDELVTLRSDTYHRCPDLDLDRLDPNNLKLVKIDLPEEKWFALSLE